MIFLLSTVKLAGVASNVASRKSAVTNISLSGVSASDEVDNTNSAAMPKLALAELTA